MFEQAFKNIDDVLWKEAGCSSELDYTEQASWLLFLKYLEDLEQDKSSEAALEGKKYTHILDTPYRWDSWAAPKDKAGKLDHNKAATGDDLRDFVNGKLFPYLHGFKQKATGPNTIEYKIGEIFGEIKNKIQSGYNLREIIDHIDELRFRSQTEKHELSHLYEVKIKNMGNAGRNGGEYTVAGGEPNGDTNEMTSRQYNAECAGWDSADAEHLCKMRYCQVELVRLRSFLAPGGCRNRQAASRYSTGMSCVSMM